MSSRPLVGLAALFTIMLVISVVRLSARVEELESQYHGPNTAAQTPAPSQPQLPRPAPAVPQPVIPRGDLSELEKSTIGLFSARSANVVHITTVQVRTDPFRRNALEVPRGTGSGFIWDVAGHVVTNFHVIQGADGARVTLHDRSVWPAKPVGVSPRNDIAVLRIETSGAALTPIQLGSSHDLSVGQQVFAIGSPFGLDYTLSTGIISGLGREIEGITGIPITGAIQTDAAINPGNSGGPLLDSSGRLIGMNTSILSPSGASAGIGFAVPADTIGRVVPQLIQYGREIRPSIGVELAEDAIVQRFGLQGALVLNVVPNSPAAKAGLKPTVQDASGRISLGDLIIAVDGGPVTKNADLFLALEKHKEGERAKLSLQRGNSMVEVEVELVLNVGN
ncbi:MAG: trypsin-like peptidase domain-containing protein [Myxococcales bacterium]